MHSLDNAAREFAVLPPRLDRGRSRLQARGIRFIRVRESALRVGAHTAIARARRGAVTDRLDVVPSARASMPKTIGRELRGEPVQTVVQTRELSRSTAIVASFEEI